MNHLAYLHSIGFSQSNLSRIFFDRENYQEFFETFSLDTLTNLGIKTERAQSILKNRQMMKFSMIDATLKKFNIKILTLHDARYPILLKNITHPPFLLYVRWDLRDTTNLISIVGSRKNSKYSEIALEKIIPDLIQAGFWVISGWAYWVDALSHVITLAHGGYTIAVVGTGVDLVYPAQNRELFSSIIQTGWAIVSQFPLSTRAEIYNFPIRNEIVAAMSRWVIIGEAAEKSWTLITARLALEMNRDVFVIPGDITRPNSVWTNTLIRDGLWKLIMSAEDVLNEYHLQMNIFWEQREKREELHFDDDTERMIYELLVQGPLDASAISDTLDIDASIVLFKCSMLEVKWFSRYDGGKYMIQ